MSESVEYERRGYTGGARATTLASGITSGATTLDGDDLSTWSGADDNGPFRFTITDGSTEEEVEATTVSGNTISGMTRGVGGTTAAGWGPGVTLEHRSSVRDYDEANLAVNRTLGQISGNGGKFFRVDAGATDIEVVTLASAHISDLAEFVRDTIGSALTEGSNIDVTVNDAGDTITLAVTGTLSAAPDYIDVPANALSLVSGTRAEGVAATGLPAGLKFPDAANNYYSIEERIPTGWATFNIVAHYTQTGSSSGSIRFMSKVIDNVGDATAFTTLLTSMTVTGITAPAVAAGTQDVVTIRSGVSCTADADVVVMIGREGADSGDTLNGADVILHKLRLVKAS